ncbi:hypothetical protein I4U23_016285 [Adineta vaga]|nr:hypothetical protein I4U23_016285 [Adineta vaga]
MSIMNGWEFQCANSTCLPFVTTTVRNILQCQTNCLGQAQCKAITCQQATLKCQLFTSIVDQNSNLQANMETTTMIVISGTRMPPEATTTSATTISTTSSSTSSSSTSTTTSSTSSTTTETTSTASTTSTTETTSSTITSSLTDPCSNRVYWNITRSQYWGTGSSNIGLNQLSSPTGLFIDTTNNNLYIADSGNYRVIRHSLSVTTNAPSGTVVAGIINVTGDSSFSDRFSTSIRYLYVDSSQNLYVADTYNNRVMRWANGASSGAIVAGNGTFGSSLNQIYYPYGIWVDSSSNVFVAEYQLHRVTKWAPGATAGIIVAGITATAGNSTDKLASPSGLYYDEANQDLYIVNSATSTSSVMRWKVGDSTGTVLAGVSGTYGNTTNQLKSPMSVVLDQWKNLYVADRSNGRVQLFCSGNSTGITIAGSGSGSGGSSLTAPYDVKLDSKLNLYVSDNSGARVSKFTKI